MTNFPSEHGTAVVVGATRGIGLALTEHLVASGQRVIATYRSDHDRSAIESLVAETAGCAVRVDLRNNETIHELGRIVSEGDSGVTSLYVVGGATYSPSYNERSSKGPLEFLDRDALLDMFDVNTVGPAIVAQQVLPHVVSGGRAVFISTIRASLQEVENGRSVGYATSKAALNMLVRKLSRAYSGESVSVFALHPGWVSTDIGGPEAPQSARTAAELIHELVLSQKSINLSGHFVDSSGNDLPW